MNETKIEKVNLHYICMAVYCIKETERKNTVSTIKGRNETKRYRRPWQTIAPGVLYFTEPVDFPLETLVPTFGPVGMPPLKFRF